MLRDAGRGYAVLGAQGAGRRTVDRLNHGAATYAEAMSAQLLAHTLARQFPPLRLRLRPGVTPSTLESAERSLGLVLPPSVRETYQTFDGQQGDLPGVLLGMKWLPLAEVLREHATWLELASEDPSLTSRPPEAVRPVTFSPAWVPIASDFAGNGLAVDLDPGPAGTVGQVITFGPDEHERLVLAPDLPAFLAWVAEQIEAGRVSLEGDAVRLDSHSSFLDAARTLF